MHDGQNNSVESHPVHVEHCITGSVLPITVGLSWRSVNVVRLGHVYTAVSAASNAIPLDENGSAWLKFRSEPVKAHLPCL